MSIACFVSGVGLSFYYGPVLAAIYIAFFPMVFICMFAFGGAVKKAAIAKMGILKKMGGMVEECLFSVKLIVSFN
jgi:ABC-type multidrug transport system fused ATPase/permease subunit